MPTRLLAGALVVASLAAFAAVNVARTANRSGTYTSYWRDRLHEPVLPGAIRLVALGDSTVQAIGAERPMEGLRWPNRRLRGGANLPTGAHREREQRRNDQGHP